MKLDYKDTDGDYSFLPYEAELTDATEAVGDGWNLRKNDEPLRAEGTLRSIPVTVLSSLEWEMQESDLKRAYSDYVDSHYRSVPAEGVERLMAYAEDLMEKTGQKGADLIPYIQEELGRRCRYSTYLDPVPAGGDFAEHFFFESKEGFCTHFATTAVLLYRMVGVPARYRTCLLYTSGDQHMVTLVSAGFGIFHIVLQGQNFDVALFGDHICDPVDIRGEGAGDPYTGDVVDVLNHVFQGGFIAVFFQFFDNALRSFDPGFNMFNGIITVNVKKFFVENFYFCADFL